MASSSEIAGEFRRPPTLIENPAIAFHKINVSGFHGFVTFTGMVLFIHPNKAKSSLVFHLVFVGVLSEMIGLNHDLRVLTNIT